MIANPIKELPLRKSPIINGWLTLGSAFAAEVQADFGYSSLTADMQHGMMDYQDMVAAFASIRASGVAPLARVPWLEPGIIMKTLDAGALGVICPMINNREQAETLVSYVRYPPKGVRSFGPTRALLSTGADNYVEQSNENIVCFAMIETGEAYENLQEIVVTPGLDGTYIGPSDLSLGLTKGRMGVGLDRREDELLEAIKRILDASKNADILAGIHCGTPEYAADAIAWGFDFVTVSNDTSLVANGAATCLSTLHSCLKNLGIDIAINHKKPSNY